MNSQTVELLSALPKLIGASHKKRIPLLLSKLLSFLQVLQRCTTSTVHIFHKVPVYITLYGVLIYTCKSVLQPTNTR